MKAALAYAMCGVAILVADADGDVRPNVVLILADDLGIEGVGCYGGQSYETPNIDRLAETGVRFTHCFSNPLCSPSRAELLTSREPLHNGIPRVIYDLAQHREFLDPAKEQSIGNLFQDAGYATAMAGKWQLSFLHERDTINAFGFDEYQAWQIFRDGMKTSRFANPSLRRNGELRDVVHGGYGPDENCQFVNDFVTRHRDDPFFVYYACLLPHYPWEPTPDSDDALKPASDGLGNKAYFPDMVAYLDTIVGRIVDNLEQLGLRERTLVVFLADNGTDKRLSTKWSDGERTASVNGGKGTMTDAGTRVPLIANWPGQIEPGVCGDLVELCDVLPTLSNICALPTPKNPINGVSFAPQLGFELTVENRRSWVHVQNMKQRHVRSRDFILSNSGDFRPVVRIGDKPAKPIRRALSDDETQERARLTKALQSVERFANQSE